jgi:hypothetical protein
VIEAEVSLFLRIHQGPFQKTTIKQPPFTAGCEKKNSKSPAAADRL